MLLADTFGGTQTILLGIALLSTGLVLWRFAFRSPRRQTPNLAHQVQREALQREKSAAARVDQIEIRLHDFCREIEGRAQTRITLLDRLVEEADSEIARLRGTLEDARNERPSSAANPGPDIVVPSGASNRSRGLSDAARSAAPLSDDQERMVLDLYAAGHTIEQIAVLCGRSAALVRLVLGVGRTDAQSEAA